MPKRHRPAGCSRRLKERLPEVRARTLFFQNTLCLEIFLSGLLCRSMLQKAGIFMETFLRSGLGLASFWLSYSNTLATHRISVSRQLKKIQILGSLCPLKQGQDAPWGIFIQEKVSPRSLGNHSTLLSQSRFLIPLE